MWRLITYRHSYKDFLLKSCVFIVESWEGEEKSGACESLGRDQGIDSLVGACESLGRDQGIDSLVWSNKLRNTCSTSHASFVIVHLKTCDECQSIRYNEKVWIFITRWIVLEAWKDKPRGRRKNTLFVLRLGNLEHQPWFGTIGLTQGVNFHLVREQERRHGCDRSP